MPAGGAGRDYMDGKEVLAIAAAERDQTATTELAAECASKDPTSNPTFSVTTTQRLGMPRDGQV